MNVRILCLEQTQPTVTQNSSPNSGEKVIPFSDITDGTQTDSATVEIAASTQIPKAPDPGKVGPQSSSRSDIVLFGKKWQILNHFLVF